MFFLIIFIICAVGLSLFGLVLVGKFPLNGYPVLMMPPLFLIFVVNALQLHANDIAYNYVTEFDFTLASFVCLLSFLAVIAGWCYVDILPRKRQPQVTSSKVYYSYNRLFIIGTACHLLSLAAELLIAANRGGLVALYSKAHNLYGDDNPLLFYLFFLTFIGTIPYLQCLFCNKKLPTSQRTIIIAVCLLQILRTLVLGHRAWVFNLVFIYVTVPFFCIGRWPKVRQIAPFVIPAAILILIFPAIRGSLYLGSSDISKVPTAAIEALGKASQGDTGSGITDPDDDSRVASEFILGAATISAAWEKNSYTYGLSFYDFLINPIPRQIWPGKPKNISLQSQIDIINSNYPWVFNNGSAPTGFADVFLNFGFFCILFWFLFGLVHRRIYDSASTEGHFYAQCVYVILLLGSTYLLNQGVLFWGTNIMNSLFFSTLFYSYARMVKPKSKLVVPSENIN
jgi:hypothetical protein